MRSLHNFAISFTTMKHCQSKASSQKRNERQWRWRRRRQNWKKLFVFIRWFFFCFFLSYSTFLLYSAFCSCVRLMHFYVSTLKVIVLKEGIEMEKKWEREKESEEVHGSKKFSIQRSLLEWNRRFRYMFCYQLIEFLCVPAFFFGCSFVHLIEYR